VWENNCGGWESKIFSHSAAFFSHTHRRDAEGGGWSLRGQAARRRPAGGKTQEADYHLGGLYAGLAPRFTPHDEKNSAVEYFASSSQRRES
jgi:hypothetical protein